MKFWINFIGFQIVWFAAVLGASKGLWWPGPVAAVAFVAAHLLGPMRLRGDGMLVVVALLLGCVVDSAYANGGVLYYAAPFPSTQLAPLWILALWAGFALTLNHSLAYLARRPLVAAIAGAIAGPLSYWSAGRAFGAVTLGEPLWRSLVSLSVGWTVAMLVLSLVARHHSAGSATPTISEGTA